MERSELIKLHKKLVRTGHLELIETRRLHSLRLQNPDFYEDLRKSIDQSNIHAWDGLNYTWYESSLNKRKKKFSKNVLYSLSAACIIALITTPFWFLDHPNKKLNQDNKLAVVTKITKTAILSNDATSISLSPAQDSIYLLEDHSIKATKKNTLMYNQDGMSMEYHTLSTPVGGQFSITLSDNSIIHLNSNSSIRYPTAFGDSVRKIYAEGEIFCEIAKQNKPFIVELSNKDRIEVLGTSFNVRDYKNEEEKEITLNTGKIKYGNDTFSKTLAPTDQLVISDQGSMLIKTVDVNNYSNWVHDRMVFNKASLQSILRSVITLYGAKYKFKIEQNNEDILYTCEIKKNLSLKENLNFLSRLTKLNIEEENSHIVISKN